MKPAFLLACVLSAAIALRTSARQAPRTHAACSIEPGSTIAVVRVEKDTLLPHASYSMRVRSQTISPSSTEDSLLARDGNPMPGGLVTLLQLDTLAQRVLAQHGITGPQPKAFLRSAPYRADCRTVRWMSRVPFLVRGEVGYVRGALASRERWIGNVPLIIISDVWNYPYPRRRMLAFGADSTSIIASPQAMFSFYTTVPQSSEPRSDAERIAADSTERDRAIRWARSHPEAAALHPLRGVIREMVTTPDWRVARAMSSRLRGSYRISIDNGLARAEWYFRTERGPRFPWQALDMAVPTADLIASPYIAGYQLPGRAALSYDSLPTVATLDAPRKNMVWFSSNDRPTTPGNSARRTLEAELMFVLAVAPEPLWDVLVATLPSLSALDSLYFAQRKRVVTAAERQPRIPLTLTIGNGGEVRADTTLVSGKHTLRIRLERIDTIALCPFRRSETHVPPC